MTTKEQRKTYSLQEVSGGQGTYCLMSIKDNGDLVSVPLVDAREYLKSGIAEIVDWYDAYQTPASSAHEDRSYFKHYTAMIKAQDYIYVPVDEVQKYADQGYLPGR